MQKRLLIIEDEQVLRVGMQRFLSRRGYQVDAAADGGSGLRLLERTAFDLVVVDLRLPDIDGAVLTRHIRAIAPSTTIMVISAGGDLQEVLGLFRAGIYDFLAKPFLLSLLEQRIRHALDAAPRLQRQIGKRSELHRQVQGEGALIGRDERVQALLGEIHWASHGVRPVLITGEEGTGKRELVRMLRQRAEGNAGPLITLDAAESSFAQAARRLQAFFSLPNAQPCGGIPASILLLENLQALSLELRNRLYLFLARAAKRQDIRGAWRLIATARDDGSAAGARDNLSGRLHFPGDACRFHLPALRYQMEELPFIADMLLTRARQHLGKPVFGVDTLAMRCLLEHTWPGNHQELQQAIEHGVAHCDSLFIGVQDLPDYLQPAREGSQPRFKLH